MKVSVVVPVFDPGPYIHDLLASMRAQTMPRADFEVILVDDGSTDGTAELLDATAAATPNVRVIHIPASGWPGRPRNVGIDAAVGEYVFLADHDDRLAPDALERLTAFADEHASDVVLGRVVGVRRPAPTHVYERTIVDAQRRPELLIAALTPQKLYRRALLVERDIRFPEGPRRLEDHLFVTKVYLRAARVSIYADSPVYYFVLREDGRNASRRPIAWAGYFGNAAEAIRVVDEEAPDEATRVVMRRRWLRVEALRRVRGRALLRRGADRAELVAAVRELLRQHYPAAEIDLLGAFDRVAARLVLEERDADLVAFAEWEAGLRVRPRLRRATVDTGGVRIELAAEQHAVAPAPEAVLRPSGAAGVERLADTARMAVVLRSGGRRIPAAVEQQAEGGVLTAVARIDAGALEDGRWTVRVRFSGVQPVAADDLVVPAADRGRVERRRARASRIRLGVDGDGRLTVTVGRGPSLLRRLLRRRSRGAAARLRTAR